MIFLINSDLGFILEDAPLQGLIWAIMAIGVFISYRLLDIADLSAEGTFPLGGAIAVIAINSGIPPMVAILLAVLAGAFFGLITGILHTFLKIPSLLAGIITLTALISINLMILKGAMMYLRSTNSQTTTVFRFFGDTLNDKYWGIIVTLILFILATFLALYWLFGTEVGVAIRATGRNQKMATAQGINSKVMILIGLAISNGLIAASGALFAQNSGYADVNSGRGTIVVGLAAIIIGETIFGKRSFKNHLLSIIGGSIIYFVILDIAITLGVAVTDLNLLRSILIIIILSLPLLKKYTNKHSLRKKSIGGAKNV